MDSGPCLLGPVRFEARYVNIEWILAFRSIKSAYFKITLVKIPPKRIRSVSIDAISR
jgi:hypothetical protein